MTDELFFLLCDRISQGYKLAEIFDSSMPPRYQLYKRLYRDEKSRDLYYAAKEMQMEAMSEEILEISDDASQDFSIDDRGRRVSHNDVVQRARLKTDSRKWIMAKMAPKRFGDKNTTEISGAGGTPLAMTIITGVPRGPDSVTRRALPEPKTIEGEKVTEPAETTEKEG
jgi:hypothetical protein